MQAEEERRKEDEERKRQEAARQAQEEARKEAARKQEAAAKARQDTALQVTIHMLCTACVSLLQASDWPGCRLLGCGFQEEQQRLAECQAKAAQEKEDAERRERSTAAGSSGAGVRVSSKAAEFEAACRDALCKAQVQLLIQDLG